MDNSQETFGVEGDPETPEGPAARSFSRRAFLQRLGLATAAAVTLSYVAPSLLTVTVPRAYAQVGTPTPEPGGCTPGYWKNFFPDGWPEDYKSDPTFFVSVFSAASAYPSLSPTETLLQVLKQGGGCERALGRHAVAALLNAATPGVGYPLTVAAVIGAVNSALSSGSCATMLATKDVLEAYNEVGCPLTKTVDPADDTY